MRHLSHINESIFKSYTSSEHIENIKDILVEYTDNNDFELFVGISPLLLSSRNKDVIDRCRTFYVNMHINEQIARTLLDIEDRPKFDNYMLHRNYFRGFQGYPGMKILLSDRLSQLKKECIDRLSKFGYRLYNNSSNDETSTSFSVTYRPNKFKY